jgi:predicted SAM-dependent methyltransferase
MKLNLGCGANRIEGFVNVDIDAELKPDEVFDFRKKFPYKDDSVDEIVMYHVIEHIERKYQDSVLTECWRVLKPNGKLTITYPEFLNCVENWKNNYKGNREFWEACIYGRQDSPSDFHVTIMHTEHFSIRLVHRGFEITAIGSEPNAAFNTYIKAKKVDNTTYEEGLVQSIGLGSN